MEVLLHAFLTSTLNESKLSFSNLLRFSVKERTAGTHWVGGWLGPRTGLQEAGWALEQVCRLRRNCLLKIRLLDCYALWSGNVADALKTRSAVIFSVGNYLPLTRRHIPMRVPQISQKNVLPLQSNGIRSSGYPGPI